MDTPLHPGFVVLSPRAAERLYDFLADVLALDDDGNPDPAEYDSTLVQAFAALRSSL